MATLYVMIGIPGSGKSTYAKTIPNTSRICSNHIRYALTNNYGDYSQDDEVFTILENKISEELKKNNSVIYDATNLSSKKRRRITEKFISEAEEIIYIFMDIPLDIAMERNKKRERKVPEEVIEDMYYALQRPTKVRDCYDKLITIKSDGSEEVKRGIKE